MGESNTHGVETQEVGALQIGVLVEEARRRRRWCLGDKDGYHGPDKEEPDSEPSTAATAGGMSDRNTEDLPEEIPAIPHDEGRLAALHDHILVAIDSSRAGELRPDDEDESQVVDPAVHAIEQIIPKLRAVHKRDQKSDDDKSEGNERSRQLVAPPVHDARDDDVQHRIGGADAEEEQRKEEEHGPEVCAGHGDDGGGVGQEANLEGA